MPVLEVDSATHHAGATLDAPPIASGAPPRGIPSVSLALCALLALPGCFTHYAPQPGPLLSTTVKAGAPVYVRDGQEFPHGFAGSGLVDAVENDPEAKEAAETYYQRNVSGLVVTAVGAACLIGAVSILATAHDARDDTANRDTSASDGAALGAIACAAAGFIAGPIVIASGQTYQFDAINIYNDHVAQRLRAYPAPMSWPVGYPGAPVPGYQPLPSPVPSPTPAPAAPPSGTAPGSPAPLPSPPPTPPSAQ